MLTLRSGHIAAKQIKCFNKYVILTAHRNQASSAVLSQKVEDTCVENEPILQYRKGSCEREALKTAIDRIASTCEDIPIVIGGKEFRTDCVRFQAMPHNHSHKLAQFYHADQKCIKNAIKTSVTEQVKWDKEPINERRKIWLRAADLIAGRFRQELNAATMLGQAKSVYQAEIDSAAELADFIRFNEYFVKECSKYQPISEDVTKTKNSMRYRGIDGFIAAITPFNFTAIAGNLAYTPALMGNAVVWKPSDTAILSNWKIFNIMREAGVPDGVVNFVPSDGPLFGDTITKSPHLSGINFTGSVPTFVTLWKHVGNNIQNYVNFPRLIGECGGKNFHFVHPSADIETVVASTIRAAFEYSGQKCSACSRMYVPESLWPAIKKGLVKHTENLKIGDVKDFSIFSSAVIDKRAYDRIVSYIEYAKKNEHLEIIAGGTYCDKTGYFIQPTIVVSTDPLDRIMIEEIFGPILTVFVYKDSELNTAMNITAQSTGYALTGAVFAQDKAFLDCATDEFKNAAGNFYINDKSTGAVVGQQPFGGGHLSGTNDKAGGPHYCLRWTSPQSIKETYIPVRDIKYPYMEDKEE